MQTDLHQLARFVRSAFSRLAGRLIRRSLWLRAKQSLAVAVVTSLLLTMPGTTGWADDQTSSETNTNYVVQQMGLARKNPIP